MSQSQLKLGKERVSAQLIERLQPQEALLREAHQRFAQEPNSDAVNPYVAEWILDNYYVVQQALRQVREDMPQGYYRRLPKLAGTALAGYPRIYAVAARDHPGPQCTHRSRCCVPLRHHL